MTTEIKNIIPNLSTIHFLLLPQKLINAFLKQPSLLLLPLLLLSPLMFCLESSLLLMLLLLLVMVVLVLLPFSKYSMSPFLTSRLMPLAVNNFKLSILTLFLLKIILRSMKNCIIILCYFYCKLKLKY